MEANQITKIEKRTFGQYKEDYIAFRKKVPLNAYIDNQGYFNVHLCYLQRMLELLHQTADPEHEWLWLREECREIHDYMNLALAYTFETTQRAITWNYDELQFYLKRGEHVFGSRYEDTTPEQELDIAERPHIDTWWEKIIIWMLNWF